MTRLKVTGYIDSEDFDADDSHASGLTAKGYEDVMNLRIGSLDEVAVEPD